MPWNLDSLQGEISQMHGRSRLDAANNVLSRSRQDGLTLISFVVISALSLFLVYLGARILPSYSEYGKVVKIMRSVASDYRPGETTPYELRDDLSRQLVIANIQSVKKQDFKIQKIRAGASLSVSYEVPIHLFGSLGVVAKFNRTVALESKSAR